MAEKKRKFGGVSEDTRVGAQVNFDVSSTNWKHDCILVKVSVERNVRKKYELLEGQSVKKGAKPTPDQVHDNSIICSLQFVFESDDNVRSYIEKMFEIDESDSNYSMKERMMNENIAQIFEATAGRGQAVLKLNGDALTETLGREMDTWQDYFEAIAKAFNQGRVMDEQVIPVYQIIRDGKTISIPLRIKLSRWKNFLQLGKGNFVERRTEKSILQKAPKEVFDIVETPTDAGSSFLGDSPKQDAPPANDEMWPDL